MPLITTFAAGSTRGLGQFRSTGVAVGPDFTISPAVSGKTSWSMTTDGNLDLSSHGEWTITASKDFTVTLKMWGGGGASGYSYPGAPLTETSAMSAGGGGGYSTATFKFFSGSSYILRVGQGGSRVATSSPGATHVAGGVGTTYGGSQGAGYSGIFKTSVSQANAILMAGGGGSGGDANYGGVGGAGGGEIAGGSSGQAGGGATQSAGGAASIYNGATAGSALTGGVAQNAVFTSSIGGGGGGYFGGGGGNVGGGGGGSGRVNTSFAEIVSSGSTTAGSGATPGNNADADRGTAGTGSSTTAKGADGKILLKAI